LAALTTVAVATTSLVAALAGAGPAAAAEPAAAEPAAVCNRFCDGRDPGLAAADRQPGTAALHGRRLTLHVDDTAAMAWATLESGQPGDEVWLDRSFDGARSWATGSRLGATGIPEGASERRTDMYNVDDWAGRGVGVLRACGRAGDRPEVACTGWFRTTWNAWDRRTAAATALMMRFDRGNGLFDGHGWWTGANALIALIDSMRVSGMRSYDYAIAATYDKQINARQGQFRNEYSDDTGWWGLAWVAAYDLTGDARYLATARADADHMHTFWDTRCGGGVHWRSDRRHKNAISNSLYIQLNAALAQRVPDDTTYRDRARTGWSWFRDTGMIRSDDIVIDAVDLDTCRATSGPLTYNQGVLIDALVQLDRLGDADALAVARRVADAATASGYLHRDGIVREPGETDSCEGDAPSWKGSYVRGLGVLNAVTGGAYTAYLQRQADRAYADNRNTFDAYGPHWAGPYVNTSHLCQQSALDLLNATP
jgi:predicted alpha-1,6-mannanase (GH76 family)